MKKILSLVLALITIAAVCGCGKKTPPEGLWKDALYTEDREFGSGSVSFTLEVKAGEKSVKFTVKTDKETVGEGLLENGLIEGEEGQWGLYVKKVNGITADYDVDQSFWEFDINGAMANTGVDMTPIKEGETYSFVYSK